MRYRRAVEKLRTLAEACESVKNWPPEDPFLLAAYVFGDVLEGADPLESVEVAAGKQHPDKKIAKAARAALVKANSVGNSARSG
jgi:hypothetical protein